MITSLLSPSIPRRLRLVNHALRRRAILFDSGLGLRNIKPAVASLTTPPVTVVSSHFHFNHVGNHTKFDQIALIGLPHLRERMHSAVFRPSNGEHLGFVEGVKPPGLVVSEWRTPGEQVNLGGRTLTVIHPPSRLCC